MRLLRQFTAAMCVFAVTSISAIAQDLPALSTDVPKMTTQQFDALLQTLKRWGEFGAEDQVGAINLITAAKRVQAAKEVKSGVSVSLANPISKTATGDFIVPLEHQTFVFPPLAGPDSPEMAAGDVFTINYHGALHSHMDGVAHFGWNGQLYNGFPFEPTDTGFPHVGLEHIAK